MAPETRGLSTAQRSLLSHLAWLGRRARIAYAPTAERLAALGLVVLTGTRQGSGRPAYVEITEAGRALVRRDQG
jgi:hypothetical protein